MWRAEREGEKTVASAGRREDREAFSLDDAVVARSLQRMVPVAALALKQEGLRRSEEDLWSSGMILA